MADVQPNALPLVTTTSSTDVFVKQNGSTAVVEQVTAANMIPTNGITGDKLATSAVTLASINSTTGQTGIGSTPVLVTGLTTTVTIPAGGRKVRIEASIPYVVDTNIATVTLYLYNGTTVAGTLLQTEAFLIAIASTGTKMNFYYEYTPTAGSQSYCIGISTDTGTANTSSLGATRVANLNVKVV